MREEHPREYAARTADKLHYRYPGAGGESYMDLIPEDKRNHKNCKAFTPEKLQEAMALLEMMEKLKS